ncbi:Hcp family type VI secretion system effector [Pseudomonas tolaasii]|uniref:Hcp family type VI secretion system effector n=2 Tax=Pseudomonas tolaasii TaxID=29442 RepID=A0A7Y8AMD2_PSETO|nr:Hcp family type VI secretion system effector [Pseudomonas tolaasii]ARB28884.1 Hcp1 family type VI secretion system effector [Pseudomonas tolaasii]KAB0478341.1 Hcp family type VI secretion system effector [Pseudomonas tolaasii]MBW4793465.1 Hcp family type VI secretion system effector [Pseudomonas tolaasii]MBY8942629.1 Hcp family type VI secretion system effector [Pseudomonas tolaasii]NVZ44921.1 Hcp family type VI secretion system effector [Pseudomonas tolaasii]
MAYHGYMSIKGKSQGLISAGCSTQDSIGNKCQEGHTDEIMVMSFNHNMLNTGNVRASTHGPVVITKNIDKSSPLLAVALSNREELSCVINFYRTSQFRQLEKYYTVDIRGCIITSLTIEVPHAVLLTDVEAQEHLAIRYREIIWTHHLAGTSGYGSWEAAR